ncbi:carboxypeptidase regulatory-like domain-containing protein [Crossiella sp. CA198]|uniref:carboxypeptidase regulatory-like domain-containing protein n=1 Tax=Crossiella sp. CA198 TaxID=3455607 RepID=UPI003F8D1485
MGSLLSARVLTGAVVLSLAVSGLVAGTASAAEGPDIRSTVSVPSGTYLPGDPITVKLTVTNVGDRGAYYLRKHEQYVSGTGFHIQDISDWGDLGPGGLGASYLPGQSREYTLRGHLGGWGGGDARFKLGPLSRNDVNPADDLGEALVPVVSPETKVVVSGQIYGDADLNGAPSAGEGLAGATVELRNNEGARTAVTGADGGYSFPGVATGKYSVSVQSLPGGWISHGHQELRLDGASPEVKVPFRALRPLAESLRVTVGLDQASYPVGAEAEIRLTLTNTGTRPLTGIHVACDRIDNRLQLEVPPEGWGELGYDAAGATVQPGQTREFRVRGTVPAHGGVRGYLYQSCDFYQLEEHSDGQPSGLLVAKVTGRDGAVSGTLFDDRNNNGAVDAGEGLANQEVRLIDLDNGHEFTAQTDGAGLVKLAGPAGRYRMTVQGWGFVRKDVVFDVVAPPSDFSGWAHVLRPIPGR